MTVKTRITLFIVGAGFFSSLLFSVVVFYELIEQPFKLLDSMLKEEAYETAAIIIKGQKESEPFPADAAPRPRKEYWIEIYEAPQNKMLFRSDLAKAVKLPPIKPGSSAIATVALADGQLNREPGKNKETTFRTKTFAIELDGRALIVQIARPMEKLNEEIRDLGFGILAGLVFSTLALIAASRFVAGKILQPIGRMKDLAQDISEKNLDKRLPAGEGRDEFSELARTINRMLDRLQYSFERQRDFLFDTSHELKTPLTTMRLAVDEICTHDPRTAPSATRENLSRVKNQVLRMERLVKDLLNLSALEALSGLDRRPVQLTALLSSLAEEYRFLTDARNITMDVRLSENLIIHGDAEKLRRAFSNMLDNAVKYNVDGGRVELASDQSTAELTVTIGNSGPGVAESEIPRVFDQFYRIEKSRSIRHGGSGLGLSIVKRIIELHNGTVQFKSEPGRWTRVIVTLPW